MPDTDVFVLQDDQRVAVTFEELDAAGNPVTDGTPPTLSSSDTSILVISDDPTSNVRHVVAVGKLGTAQITASLTTKSSKEITGSKTVEVVAGEAATIVLTFGAPEPKPVPTP